MEELGHVRIADFGLARITKGLGSLPSLSRQEGYTILWVAPEVWSQEEYSPKADIFSFAMVMIEVRHTSYMIYSHGSYAKAHCNSVPIKVFTGAIPFSGQMPLVAMLNMTRGERPPRPTHPTFTDNLWTLMQRCWDDDPHQRPETSQVLEILWSVPRLLRWISVR